MAKLKIGSRRIVNCYDGNGGDDWIPGTLEWWDEPNYATFKLDRKRHDGGEYQTIPLPYGRHRLRNLNAT